MIIKAFEQHVQEWASLMPERCQVDRYGVHVLIEGSWHSVGLQPHKHRYCMAVIACAIEAVIEAEKLHYIEQFNPATGVYFVAVGIDVDGVGLAQVAKSTVKVAALLDAFMQCLRGREASSNVDK